MTFPNVIKTAPRHPNIALMYPILIERGPAAGGEALTDNNCLTEMGADGRGRSHYG